MSTNSFSSAYFHAAVHRNVFKEHSRWAYGDFSSLDEKFDRLFEMCRSGGIAYGTAARELLNVGGDVPMFWLDLDSRNHEAVENWKKSRLFPFPSDSFVDVSSTTGKHHFFVACDRIVKHEECFGLFERIVETVEDPHLAREIDRVYGQESWGIVYIPGSARGEPVLPQILISSCRGRFIVPNDLRIVPSIDWVEEKRDFLRSLDKIKPGQSMRAVLERVCSGNRFNAIR